MLYIQHNDSIFESPNTPTKQQQKESYDLKTEDIPEIA